MRHVFCGFILMLALWVRGQADPFDVTVHADAAAQAVEIKVVVPVDHYLYQSAYSVRFLAGVEGATEVSITPAAVPYNDPFEGTTVPVFKHSFVQLWRATRVTPPVTVEIAYQGCDNAICFMPQRRTISSGPTPTSTPATDVAPLSDGDGWLAGLHELGRVTGYLGPADFLAELDAMTGAAPAATGGAGLSSFARDPAAFLKHNGMVWTFLIVLVGGLLLNLTPCVLPMIPVNLGIIGAGSGGRRGFVLGLAYGAGIAVVYGALGIVAVMAGGVFGALQGSPIFNAAVAVIFVLLGLALFDVFAIDFSRLQGSAASGNRRGLAAAAFAGGFSALLAGACVAPVVVAVLLLSASLYAQGVHAGALLPLGLGLGMALPWPFAGMGVSCLPKPGRWMEGLKRVLAIFVFALAIYYGWVAWQGFRPATVAGSIVAGDQKAWQQEVVAARAAGKPLLVDFWATWCKNCHALERRTFRDATVAERLKEFHVVRVQAERPDEEPSKGMTEAFAVRGLPTVVILANE